jgi:hypothetical protein
VRGDLTESEGVCRTKGTVADIRVFVDSTSDPYRILAEKPLKRRVVVARPVVVPTAVPLRTRTTARDAIEAVCSRSAGAAAN